MQKNCLLSVLIAGLLFGVIPLSGQGLFTWGSTGLTMELPYDTASAEVVDDGNELLITWSKLEISFLSVSKDSVERYFADRYLEFLMGIVDELELIPLSTPQKFPSTPDGVWFTAIDTAIFTDTVLLGAISWPGAALVVIALFDCYGSPLNSAISIMQSLAFKQYARPKND